MEKINILIVEDNLIIALDLKATLEKLDYNVVSIVSNGEKALLLAEELKPELILMDIGLKGNLNGMEAGELIRYKFNIPVIYLTGNGNLLKKANISAPFINKPFENEELKRTIISVISLQKDIS